MTFFSQEKLILMYNFCRSYAFIFERRSSWKEKWIEKEGACTLRGLDVFGETELFGGRTNIYLRSNKANGKIIEIPYFNFIKQCIKWPPSSLLRSRLSSFGTEKFLMPLIPFFQKGNANKMLLRFKTYLLGLLSCHC